MFDPQPGVAVAQQPATGKLEYYRIRLLVSPHEMTLTVSGRRSAQSPCPWRDSSDFRRRPDAFVLQRPTFHCCQGILDSSQRRTWAAKDTAGDPLDSVTQRSDWVWVGVTAGFGQPKTSEEEATARRAR